MISVQRSRIISRASSQLIRSNLPVPERVEHSIRTVDPLFVVVDFDAQPPRGARGRRAPRSRVHLPPSPALRTCPGNHVGMLREPRFAARKRSPSSTPRSVYVVLRELAISSWRVPPRIPLRSVLGKCRAKVGLASASLQAYAPLGA